MGVKMLENQLRNHEAFSVATLIYARLRRVSGRVIDAIYLAEQTHDPELSRLIGRLNMVLDIQETGQDSQIGSAHPTQQEGLISVEPDEDDIYRAQVSNRYIGALR